MVGSAGLTRQPAARRSQTGLPPRVPRARRRGAPAATSRPRQQPLGRARTRAAGRGEGCRRSAAQRMTTGLQAAAVDARPRPPLRQKTLATPAAVHVVRVCRSPAPRARSAPPSAATSPSPSPSPPPARGRAGCSASLAADDNLPQPIPASPPRAAHSQTCRPRAAPRTTDDAGVRLLRPRRAVIRSK